MGTVHQTFTGDAKGVLKELERVNKDYTRLEEKMNKVALASANANKKSREGAAFSSSMVGRAVNSIKDWAMSYLSVQAAIQAVTNAMREQQAVADQGLKTKMSVAGSQAAVLKNIGDVSDADARKFLASTDAIAKKHGMASVVPLNQAAASVLSGTGGNQQQALEILDTIAPMFKDEPEAMATFGGALADLQRSSGIKSAKEAAALMLAIQGQSRGEKLEGFQYVAPALAAVDKTSRGDRITDTREGAALFAAIGSELGDVEGARTKTAVSNLAARLEKLVPQKDTTFERIDVVRQNKKLRDEILKSGFEGPTVPVIRELLTGDGGQTGAGVKRAFTAIDGSVDAYDRKVKQLTGLTPELQSKTTASKIDAAAEKFDRSTDTGDALARKILFGAGGEIGTLQRTRGFVQGTAEMGDSAGYLDYELRKAVLGNVTQNAPEQAAIQTLMQQRRTITGWGTLPMTEERAARVELIDQGIATLVEEMKRTREATEASVEELKTLRITTDSSGRKIRNTMAPMTLGKNSERN